MFPLTGRLEKMAQPFTSIHSAVSVYRTHNNVFSALTVIALPSMNDPLIALDMKLEMSQGEKTSGGTYLIT